MAIGETPFSLAYETEAMVPVELKIPTHRVQYCDELANDEKLHGNLDALEEFRDMLAFEPQPTSKGQPDITIVRSRREY